MKIRIQIGITLFTALLFFECERKSVYEKKVEDELSTGIRYDSLFLNIKFGMTVKEFFDTCWDMNKDGTLTQGPGNLSAQYKLDSGLNSPVNMRFYPDFNQDSIYKMPVEFVYENWAPWHKPSQSENLLPDVRNLLEKWYGGSFMEMKDPNEGNSVWVKVDGNRRITMGIKDQSIVRAVFTDLSVKIKEEEEK